MDSAEQHKKRKQARRHAQARLVEWGSCIRAVALRDAPNPDMYNRAAFYNPRVNFDHQKTEASMFQGRRWERGIETDELIRPIRDSNPTMWTAIQIRYVMREPGHFRKLPGEIQLEVWRQQTGKGKTAYYRHLLRAEEYLAMRLGA